ncbi:MAG: hypothetical protein WCS18_05265 [Sphaerochaetaceae bacterium]
MNEDLKKALNSGEGSQRLVDVIRAGALSKRKTIQWPGYPDVRVTLRLLSASETREARLKNQEEWDKAKVEVTALNITDFKAQEAAHGLVKAILLEDGSAPVFRGVEQLRASVSDDELTALAQEYSNFADECDPSLTHMSDEDVTTLFEALKKTPDLIRGKVKNLDTALRLLRISVGQPQN